MHVAAAVLAALCALLAPRRSGAEEEQRSSLLITRVTTAISIDGNLTEDAWRNATPITNWFEVNPGDNTPPRVKNVGYVLYDDHFLYVGLQFEDPEPSQIRSPLGTAACRAFT